MNTHFSHGLFVVQKKNSKELQILLNNLIIVNKNNKSKNDQAQKREY